MISHCPRCRYLAAGAKLECRCSECGLEFDRRGHMYKELRLVQLCIALFYSIAIAVLALGDFVFYWWRISSATYIFGGAMLAPVLWGLLSRTSVVVVDPIRVTVLASGKDPFQLQIMSIGDVHWSLFFGSVEIVGRDGSTLISLPGAFLGSIWRNWQLAREIRLMVHQANKRSLEPQI